MTRSRCAPYARAREGDGYVPYVPQGAEGPMAFVTGPDFPTDFLHHLTRAPTSTVY